MLAEINKFLEDRIEDAVSDETEVYRVMRDKPGYDRVPHSIYFYYVRFDADGLPDIRHYWIRGAVDPIAYGEVDEVITALALNARRNGSQPKPHGFAFEGMAWDRISYLAILIDSPHWKMWKRENGKVGFKFVPTKGSTPNHTFFDAQDLTIDIEGDDRDAIVMINHMKGGNDGMVLGHGREPATVPQFFAFDLFCDVGDHSGGGKTSVFIIDPGGNNMGPPVPPPDE